MSQHPTLGHGKICYIELPSRDVNESASFYKNVFGWNIRRREDGHVSFDDGVMEVSGTWRTDRKPVTELGTFIHLMVDDIEVAMKRVVDNGGKIVRPVGGDAPEITAWFSDPTGNVLGLFQEKEIKIYEEEHSYWCAFVDDGVVFYVRVCPGGRS